MTPVTVVLVLASAVVHATWNLWAKQVGPGARPAALMWLLTGISSVAYAPIALWMFAHGTWRPGPLAVGVTAASGGIHVVYFLLLLRGYRVGDLSLVYPVARGTGPMLAFGGALALFGEKLSAGSLAGVLLVVTGVLVLTAGAPIADRTRIGPGLRYGLLTGVLICTYTLWDGWAVKVAAVPALLFYWGGELARVALFTPAALAQRDELARLWREQRPRVLGIALLSPLSYILVLLAMRTGEVSRIAPAREVGILIGAWLGGRVLGEGQRRRRLVAAAAFAAGVIALAVG